MTQRKSSAEIEAARFAGERIRVARGSQSQASLAAKVGISRAALANYELGRSLAPEDVLKRIGDVTGQRIDPPLSQAEFHARLFEHAKLATGLTDDEWAVLRTLRTLSANDARQVISSMLALLEEMDEEVPLRNPAFARDLALLYAIASSRRSYNGGADKGALVALLAQPLAGLGDGQG